MKYWNWTPDILLFMILQWKILMASQWHAVALLSWDIYVENTLTLLLSSTHHHILTNQWIFNTLLDHPIYHISSSISDHYFFKQQNTMPTPVFTTPSCGLSVEVKLIDFCNIFAKFHKLEWRISNLKNRHFRPTRVIFSGTMGLFVIYI